MNKYDDLIICLGEIDELNSHLGIVKNIVEQNEKEMINNIQLNLMTICSNISGFDNKLLNDLDLDELEKHIDLFMEYAPKKFAFTVPGANQNEAKIHVARTVCRRAERSLHKLCLSIEISKINKQYINRLSDYLYSLTIYEARLY